VKKARAIAQQLADALAAELKS